MDQVVDIVTEVLTKAQNRIDKGKIPIEFINFDYKKEFIEELADAVNYFLFRAAQIILALEEKGRKIK